MAVGRHLSLAVPVAVGLSVGDYFELGGRDYTFGFGSIGLDVTTVLGSTWGSRWSLRGGVDLQRLGTTPRVFNAGKRSLLVGSIGLSVDR